MKLNSIIFLLGLCFFSTNIVLSQSNQEIALLPICSEDPDINLVWLIHNTTEETVELDWKVNDGNNQLGILITKPGDNFLITNTEQNSENILSISGVLNNQNIELKREAISIPCEEGRIKNGTFDNENVGFTSINIRNNNPSLPLSSFSPYYNQTNKTSTYPMIPGGTIAITNSPGPFYHPAFDRDCKRENFNFESESPMSGKNMLVVNGASVEVIPPEGDIHGVPTNEHLENMPLWVSSSFEITEDETYTLYLLARSVLRKKDGKLKFAIIEDKNQYSEFINSVIWISCNVINLEEKDLCNWNNHYDIWTSSFSGNVRLAIFNEEGASSGNDFVVDDIRFRKFDRTQLCSNTFRTKNGLSLNITEKIEGTINGSTTTCEGNIESYEVSLDVDTEIMWSVRGGEIKSGQGSNNITIEWDSEGKGIISYNLTGSCILSSSTLEITVVSNELCDIDISSIFIPNVFTPNNDSYNDSFVVKNLELFPENTLKIYNRLGELVLQEEGYENDWLAENVSGGSYYYELVLEERVFKGWVQILK